jgi:acyl-CoA reductase-like NAD-dependent aldehyde dehydrogenase
MKAKKIVPRIIATSQEQVEAEAHANAAEAREAMNALARAAQAKSKVRRTPPLSEDEQLRQTIARMSTSELWIALANNLEGLNQYAIAGEKQAEVALSESLPRIERLINTSVAAGFGRA